MRGIAGIKFQDEEVRSRNETEDNVNKFVSAGVSYRPAPYVASFANPRRGPVRLARSVHAHRLPVARQLAGARTPRDRMGPVAREGRSVFRKRQRRERLVRRNAPLNGDPLPLESAQRDMRPSLLHARDEDPDSSQQHDPDENRIHAGDIHGAGRRGARRQSPGHGKPEREHPRFLADTLHTPVAEVEGVREAQREHQELDIPADMRVDGAAPSGPAAARRGVRQFGAAAEREDGRVHEQAADGERDPEGVPEEHFRAVLQQGEGVFRRGARRRFRSAGVLDAAVTSAVLLVAVRGFAIEQRAGAGGERPEGVDVQPGVHGGAAD